MTQYQERHYRDAFAELSVESNSTATVVSSSSTDFSNKVQVTIFDSVGPSQDMIPNLSSGHIEITRKGVHKFSATNLSFSGVSGDTISLAFFKNNGATQISKRVTRKLGTGGDVGAVGISGLAFCEVGDTVELWLQNEGATGNVTVEDVTMIAESKR